MPGGYSMIYAWSVISGLLLALIFPRFNFFWLAWFAFLPLFYAIRASANPRQAAQCCFLMGLPFYGITSLFINTLSEWVGGLIVLGWLILTLSLSLYPALFAYLLKRSLK
ncbi:MAG: hypothetical protein PHH60_04850, partial [Candidatus Margulisbacteria bacterium]|nr:hypothetical protein [Candidatus Margulisiibacteriota bacterium]